MGFRDSKRLICLLNTAMLGWGEDEQVATTVEALSEGADSLVTGIRCCCCSAHAQWLKLAGKLQWKNRSGRQIKNLKGNNSKSLDSLIWKWMC